MLSVIDPAALRRWNSGARESPSARAVGRRRARAARALQRDVFQPGDAVRAGVATEDVLGAFPHD